MSLSDFTKRVASALDIELPQGPNPKFWQYADAVLLRGDIQRTMDEQRKRAQAGAGAAPAPTPTGQAPAYRRPPSTSEYGYTDFARGGVPAPMPVAEPAVLMRRPLLGPLARPAFAPLPPGYGPGAAPLDPYAPSMPRNPIQLPPRPWLSGGYSQT